jgi:hypothetical protein
VAGCHSQSQSEAEIRLRQYFQVPAEVSLESNPSPILKHIPIGTPETDIYRVLDQDGIGKDGLSSYYRAGERGEIVCRVEYDVKTPGLVKESFVIFLLLDADRKLVEARVRKDLTGL